MDWRSFVESLSVVEQALREDPADMYACQDFATRDRYRHVIEDVARGCPRGSYTEQAVARAAIGLAQTAAEQRGGQHRSAHVGYYLIEPALAPVALPRPHRPAHCTADSGVTVILKRYRPGSMAQRNFCHHRRNRRLGTGGATGEFTGDAAVATTCFATPGFFPGYTGRSPDHGSGAHFAESGRRYRSSCRSPGNPLPG